MKRFYFMNPKTMYNETKAKEYLSTEYGIEDVSILSDDKLDMSRYIQQFIEASGYKEKLNISALGINIIGNREQTIWKKLIDDVCNIISEPTNYYADIRCAIFMGWIYNMEEYDLFKLQIDERPKEGESKEECETRLLLEKQQLAKMKSGIQDAWKRSDSHVNKAFVRKFYPVPVLQVCDKDSYKEYDSDDVEIHKEKYNIESIPGGCYEYHKTMISQAHINIFDVDTEIKDYTRYSFKNTYGIYDSLKESYVENLLLMEYSLGIGYINQMYPYICELDTIKKVEDILTVINAGTSITPFIIRMKIMNLIFSSGIKMNTESEVGNAAEFIDAIANVVLTVFERGLKLEWYRYCYFLSNKKEQISYLDLYVNCIWKEYYNDDQVYKDWISECNINDWRNIKGIDDCFCDDMSVEQLIDMTKNFGFSKYPHHYWYKVVSMQIQNVFGEKVTIYIGAPKNRIGDAIKCQVQEKMKEQQIPKTLATIYKRYFILREEAYKEIRKKEKKIFNKMQIKIRKNNKTKEQKLDKQHVYALLSYEVIRSLLYTK